MDLHFNFSDVEDFGMAKCFSNAPIGMIGPHFANEEEMVPAYGTDMKECEKAMSNEIRSDGFCFKLAPTEDVSSNQSF
jgi:hypothetical protein